MALFERSEFDVFRDKRIGMRELDSRQARSRGERFLVLFFGEKRTDTLNKKYFDKNISTHEQTKKN